MIFELSSESGTHYAPVRFSRRPQADRKATGAVFGLVIGLLFAAGLLLVTPSIPVAHATAFGLDGSAGCSNGNGVSCTVALTTFNSADIVIIFTGTTQGHATSAPTVPAGCTGLTNRVIYAGPGANVPVIREDYCTASGALSSQSFTCTATGRITCVVFGISGANTGSPFDGDGALPSKAGATTGASTTNAVTTALSTNNANDFVFGLVAESGGSGTWSVGTNARVLDLQVPLAGSTNTGAGAAAEYVISTTTISSSAIAAKYANNGAYAIVADAVQMAVTTVTVTSTQTVTSTAFRLLQ